MYLLLMTLGLALGQTEPLPDAHWPQWRGPNGDSIAAGQAPPTSWSNTENVIWAAPLPGWGNSTPAIWGDAIFVTTQVNDERLLLLRLDRKTGQVVWEREVGKGTPRRKGPVGQDRFHDENNMASPSPTTDGKHVWAHFGNGDLACYDFDGKQVWAVNLQEKYGPYTIWWGHANSPVVVDDLLITAAMQDPKGGGKNYVVALEKLTGQQRWLAERNTGAKEEYADSYTTPLVHHAAGRKEVLIYGGNVLDAYDPATGKRLWYSTVFNGNRVISGPTLSGGTVYAVQGMRGPLFAIKTGGRDNVTASHLQWKYAGGTPDAACPLVVNGLVFIAANNGIVTCLDQKSGEELWKDRLGKEFRASPLSAGGRVYFAGKDGKTSVIEAARELKLVATSELGEEVIASPAVAAGDLYIRSKKKLYRIGGK